MATLRTSQSAATTASTAKERLPLISSLMHLGKAYKEGRRRIRKETGEFPAFQAKPEETPGMGALRSFSEAADKVMLQNCQEGESLDLLMRSRLASSFARRLALALKDEDLFALADHVSGHTKIGLLYVPENAGALSQQQRMVLRACYPRFSVHFADRFDDGSALFRRAKAMLRYQQVAYDGKGSFNSPSYPFLKKGSKLPIEVRITKLVEAFTAVLYKRFKPDLSDAEDARHTDFAAAAMVAVSGKDVCPQLTARLLSILYNTGTAYTGIVVERLSHPEPGRLEEMPGEDLRYAQEVVLRSSIFRDLVLNKGVQDDKRREEKRRRRCLGEADTGIIWPRNAGNDVDWTDDTAVDPDTG